jgi:hypothetical protein
VGIYIFWFFNSILLCKFLLTKEKYIEENSHIIIAH